MFWLRLGYTSHSESKFPFLLSLSILPLLQQIQQPYADYMCFFFFFLTETSLGCPCRTCTSHFPITLSALGSISVLVVGAAHLTAGSLQCLSFENHLQPYLCTHKSFCLAKKLNIHFFFVWKAMPFIYIYTVNLIQQAFCLTLICLGLNYTIFF